MGVDCDVAYDSATLIDVSKLTECQNGPEWGHMLYTKTFELT
jgi:hypothetical protein